MLEKFKKNLQFYFGIIFKIYLLFLSFFAVYRFIFIIIYWDKIARTEAPISEIFYVFISALKLDIGIITTSAILIVWLILLLHSIFKLSFLIRLTHFYTFIVGFIYSLISIIELGIYREWEEKPSFEILTYFSHPMEAFHSAPLGQFVVLLLILTVIIIFFYKIMKKIFSSSMQERSWTFSLFFIIFTPVLLLLLARGGSQPIPISQSDAYYSKHKILNNISINTTYNFLHSIIENNQLLSGVNPYISKDEQIKKLSIIKPYLNQQHCNNQIDILNNKKPNIVLVIMESFSGYFLDKDKIIPEFMSLTKQGILFTNLYGSGTLSHEGLPAILSGWPAIDDIYITNSPQKFKYLPTITAKLKQQNYSSLFLFGGDLNYGNLKSYIYNNNFDTFLEGKDMKKMLPNETPGALGYHDKVTLHLLNKLTNSTPQPFFNAIFTVSSHSPYDQPLQNKIKFGGEHKKYYNSVYYTDKSIRSFIKEAKNKKWYKNTLFIFVADHSHANSKYWSRDTPMWHHIPMLFFGEVIKKEYRGKRINKIVSQHDLASTLLNQLDINTSEFKFSRNVLCSDYKQGAYYMVNGGYGFITPQGSYAYNFKIKKEVYKDKKPNKKLGHYYLENLFNEFIKLSKK
ncbi:putative sulfatase [hydrothermal vent metagenome]|uniref:Putative sulfatase n=1 Tax=hydrothermal vent metagenome TaxID=652676 RepID=A0A1W1CGB6_9ZZZZ